MDGLLGQLNSAQRAAVTSNSDVLQVLAPPGSGKTKTLTARVAYVLTHHGYRPENIICCTFTIKAAKEMRERLTLLVGDQVQSRLILGTFHSICLRYLKRYGYHIGIPNQFGVADSAESLAILRRTIKERKLNINERIARARISRKKAQGFGFDESKPAKAKSIGRKEFEDLYDAYENELNTSNRLDYDDLLLRCQQLLKEFPACVSNVEAVLIDEFQDTNTVQYELMKLFASRQQRITIVGDPDQSIYGFRSAEIKNLTRMKDNYPETTAIILKENYRSCGAILRAAQNVIEQDTARPSKSLQATHSYGTLPTLRKLPSAAAEATWVVIEIQRAVAMTGNMLTHSDFAILLRSAHLSRQIESAMGKAGIPYQMVGGCRFYDRLEIRILLDYLKVVYQPNNNEALLAIMNVPARKIGDKSRETLLAEAKGKGCSLFDFVRQISQGTVSSKARLSKPAEQNLGLLVSLILFGQQTMKCLTPAAEAPKVLLDCLIKKLSFKKFLEDTHSEDFESRWANVEELYSQAEDMSLHANEQLNSEALPEIEGIEQREENGAESVLSQFLANISLSSQADALEDEVNHYKVTISTIHAAKGLEWPVIFVPALYEGSIPHSRAEDTDEERRLLYVAMTRAQSLLYLSQPLHQSGAYGSEETVLSSFVTPKSADKFFQATGSTFSDEMVKTVAETLRRQVPAMESVVQAMESLRSTEDDLWPASGERGEFDRALYDDMSMGSSKRKFKDDNPANMRSLLGTFEIASSISTPMSSGPVTMGFTTAADHLRTQPPPTLAPSRTIASSSSAYEPRTSAPPKPPKRSKTAPPPNQPTISSLFGQNQQPPRDKSKTDSKLDLAKARAGLRAPTLPSLSLPTAPVASTAISFQARAQPQSQPQSQSQSLNKPSASLPASLTSHRLPSSSSSVQNGALKVRPKPLLESTSYANINSQAKAKARVYGFLSSSPSPTQEEFSSLGSTSKAVDSVATTVVDENVKGGVEDEKENEKDKENEDEDYGARAGTVKAVGVGVTRPASTFHCTTTTTNTTTAMTAIGQCQGRQVQGVGGIYIKRRYGMGGRGGMKGWADRKNK